MPEQFFPVSFATGASLALRVQNGRVLEASEKDFWALYHQAQGRFQGQVLPFAVGESSTQPVLARGRWLTVIPAKPIDPDREAMLARLWGK